jgi:hypothetical protein
MSKTGKIVTIFLWVIIIVSAVLLVSLMANISENEQDPTMNSWINSTLVWSYILILVGAGVAIIAGLIQAVTDIRAAKKALMAIGFFAVILLVSYLLASDSIPQFLGVEDFINDGTLTAQIAKMIDMGLYATYILIGIAVLSIAFSSVTRLLK